MTAPRHAAVGWDDERDVERAMRSLDDMEATVVVDLSDIAEITGAPQTAGGPSVAPASTAPAQAASVPPVINGAQAKAPVKDANQQVLRRKPTPRSSSADDVRTLRRSPRPAPAPVASQPYDESSFAGNTMASERVRQGGRSAASGPLLVAILLLRLLAISFCCLVVLMAIPALGDRAAMVRISSAAGALVPPSISGILVLPTPFGGAFRGDFALAAFIVYIVDWTLTNVRARIAWRGVR